MNDHGHETHNHGDGDGHDHGDGHGDGHANGSPTAGGHHHEAVGEGGHSHDHDSAQADWPMCPVCEMRVDPATSPSLEYQGTTYWFCNAGCKTDFEYKPSDYVTASPA